MTVDGIFIYVLYCIYVFVLYLLQNKKKMFLLILQSSSNTVSTAKQFSSL